MWVEDPETTVFPLCWIAPALVFVFIPAVTLPFLLLLFYRQLIDDKVRLVSLMLRELGELVASGNSKVAVQRLKAIIMKYNSMYLKEDVANERDPTQVTPPRSSRTFCFFLELSCHMFSYSVFTPPPPFIYTHACACMYVYM